MNRIHVIKKNYYLLSKQPKNHDFYFAPSQIDGASKARSYFSR